MVPLLVEPFPLSLFDHGSIPSAYPHLRDRALLLLNIYFAWTQASSDEIVQQAAVILQPTFANWPLIRVRMSSIWQLCHPWHAIEQDLWNNLPRLLAIKAAVNPTNVMRLAGGLDSRILFGWYHTYQCSVTGSVTISARIECQRIERERGWRIRNLAHKAS